MGRIKAGENDEEGDIEYLLFDGARDRKKRKKEKWRNIVQYVFLLWRKLEYYESPFCRYNSAGLIPPSSYYLRREEEKG